MTARGETTAIPLTPTQATLARDALAKACYAKLFEWVVNRINETMRGSATPESPFIGLLDVYGFESFNINTFEQVWKRRVTKTRAP